VLNVLQKLKVFISKKRQFFAPNMVTEHINQPIRRDSSRQQAIIYARGRIHMEFIALSASFAMNLVLMEFTKLAESTQF